MGWRRGAAVLVAGAVLAASPLPSNAAAASGALAPPPPIESHNWSGYLADAGARISAYIGVRGAFVQPAVSRGCYPEADVHTWVGIGGYHQRAKTRALIQVGTVADVDIASGTTYWAFLQYLRTDLRGAQLAGSEKVRLPIRIRPGDRIGLSVAVDGGTATFAVRNDTTGATATRLLPMPSQFRDGRTAEWVAERTGTIKLARFGAVHWIGASVRRADGGWHPLGGEPGRTEVRMVSGRHTLAVPESMTSPTAFTTRWRGCR